MKDKILKVHFILEEMQQLNYLYRGFSGNVNLF